MDASVVKLSFAISARVSACLFMSHALIFLFSSQNNKSEIDIARLPSLEVTVWSSRLR